MALTHNPADQEAPRRPPLSRAERYTIGLLVYMATHGTVVTILSLLDIL